MKKLNPVRLFVFITLTGLSTWTFSQPQSKEELHREYAYLAQQKTDCEDKIFNLQKKQEQTTSSIEIGKKDQDLIDVVYTKPAWDSTTPEIQLIAKNVHTDSENTYHMRIVLFTKRATEKSYKIHIKIPPETVKLDHIKDNPNTGSGIINVCKNWGSCAQSGRDMEGYTYTYYIKMTQKDFFAVISSKDITIRFFNIGIPDLTIPYSNVIKLNDLCTYLTLKQEIDDLNQQLKQIRKKMKDIEKRLNSV